MSSNQKPVKLEEVKKFECHRCGLALKITEHQPAPLTESGKCKNCRLEDWTISDVEEEG